MLIETEQTLFFSSNENLGAQNKDLNGSRFQVRLDRPVSIPPSAVDVSIECSSANIWYTSPNIAEEYGNNKLHLRFYQDPGFSISADVVLTIPDGLYGGDTLNAVVQRLISNTVIPYLIQPDPQEYFSPSSIRIYESPAEQKLVIELSKFLGINTDPLAENNVAYTLGFTTDVFGQFTGRGQKFVADEIAKLNRINSYLLHSDIVQDGISINSSYDSILTEIQLDVGPGELITFRPYHPYKISGRHLKHGPRDLITFYLTDEQNRPIDTFGEDFSFTIVIKYKLREHSAMLNINVPHV